MSATGNGLIAPGTQRGRDRCSNVRLGDVLELQRRWVKPDPDELYTEIGVRSYGHGIFHKAPVSGLDLGNKRVLRIEPGDLVFNNVFAWEGAVAVAAESEAGMIGSHRFVTFRPKESSCDVRYLQYYFRHGAGLEVAKRASPGSAGRNRTFGIQRFLRQSIMLPSVEEQRRVVAKIEHLRRKIDEARGLSAKSRLASELLWRGGADAVLKDIDEPLWVPLGDVVEISGGGTPSKKNPLFWDGDIPWVSPKDMKTCEIHDSEDHITEAGLDGSAARLHQPGALLIVIRGMILVHTVPVAVLRVPATINQDMKALRPRGGVEVEYLAAVLRALNGKLVQAVDRSSHDTRKLVTPKLSAFTVPVPPIKEQRRVVACLADLQNTVDQLRSLQNEAAAELEALFPSILDKAFRGEL